MEKTYKSARMDTTYIYRTALKKYTDYLEKRFSADTEPTLTDLFCDGMIIDLPDFKSDLERTFFHAMLEGYVKHEIKKIEFRNKKACQQ